MYYNGDCSGAQDRSEWIAVQYRDILVINLVLQPTYGTTLISLSKDVSTHPQLVTLGGWAQDYPDPQNWLSVFWTCDSTFAAKVGYCNEEFDRLTHLGDTTVDPDERLGYYKQAGEILIQDQPGPFIMNPAANVVVNPEVTGYTPKPAESEWPGQFSSLMTITKNG